MDVLFLKNKKEIKCLDVLGGRRLLNSVFMEGMVVRSEPGALKLLSQNQTHRRRHAQALLISKLCEIRAILLARNTLGHWKGFL